ncbi:MAG TPA: hypothetical protein VMT88_10625 [Actinomycetes bacterium]|nr:hypothetical protein [Actinomycetes bacterium]
MPTAVRWRTGVVWTLTWAVPVLAILAVLASLKATLEFTGTGQTASTAGVALVGLCGSACALIGGTICARTPNIRIGALLLGLGWVIALTLAWMSQAALDLPGSAWVPSLLSLVTIQVFPLMAMVLLLFPDGHLLSPRWRPAVWLIVAIAVLSVLLTGFDPQISDPRGAESVVNWFMTDSGAHLLFTLIPVALLSGAVSLVLRFRRSTGVIHVQLKWLAFAAVVATVAQVMQTVLWTLAQVYGLPLGGVSFVVLALGFTAIPVACGVAILRYHLFDIDRVVSRSVAYLGVTAVVVTVYLCIVATMTYFLPVQTNLAVALGTLAAASVLEPTRRHVQRAVDRRFNRARYDSVQTVEAFGVRLSHVLDDATVPDDLLQTVAATLQPSTLALYERPLPTKNPTEGRPSPSSTRTMTSTRPSVSRREGRR